MKPHLRSARPRPPDPPVACPGCGAADYDAEPMPADHPHHAHAECRRCGRTWWVPAPMTAERAAGFRMPFGRFKGRTFAEIGSTGDGRSYLAWLRDTETVKKTIRAAAARHLETLRAEQQARN